MASSPTALPAVPFTEAVKVWARIGLLSFGGPAGQIALMHRELVERRRWVDEERFLHALNFCMLLPGPEAQQLAIYLGWLMHRTRGGIVAGTLFVLPGVLTLLVLSTLYAVFGQLPWVVALFFGLKCAVLAVVFEAVSRIGKRALKTPLMWGLAATAFCALFLFAVPFPLVVAGAAGVGVVVARTAPRLLPSSAAKTGEAAAATVLGGMESRGELGHSRPSRARAVRVLAVCLALWWVPVGALRLLFGSSSVFVTEGLFFSQAAVVTFGGAYAVLAWVAQRAVEDFGWLKPTEMLDGLGLAETTPGPLILVLQFVGFLAAYRNPGALPPLGAAVLGAAVTVWTTFVPCFLWILLGAPYVEALRGNRTASAALSCITAAVVGVILNLSVWFSVHVLFRVVHDVTWGPLHLAVPVGSSVELAALALSAGAMLALFRFKLGLPVVLGSSAGLGLVLKSLAW